MLVIGVAVIFIMVAFIAVVMAADKTSAAPSYEEQIIAKHSTPGLKKFMLTRQAKKEQLNAQGMSRFPKERDELLDRLYPDEIDECSS
jgi:hypothetical protein